MRVLLNLAISLIYIFSLILIFPFAAFLLGLWGLGNGQEGGLEFIAGASLFLFCVNTTWYTFFLWVLNKKNIWKNFYFIPLFFFSAAILIPFYRFIINLF